jgi:hypothetical protein
MDRRRAAAVWAKGDVGKRRMSLQALLEPTNGDPPCGPNLEYDPEFVAVDQALRPRPEQLVGEPAAGSAEPDWADIRRRCEALLGRPRDLRLAMMYARALTHTDQLPGFADGLGLVSGLLERYWPNVFLSMATYREFEGETDKVREGTTYVFDRSGQVKIRRERFIPQHTIESTEARTDVSANYSPAPTFGEYGDLVRKERL